MDLGKKIKSLRLQKGVTQETLASELGVTAQAVSKWENGTTLPDIQLLPPLSVFFGVSIDELFEMTDEAHLERIENMLENEAFISRTDFDRAMEFLNCTNHHEQIAYYQDFMQKHPEDIRRQRERN